MLVDLEYIKGICEEYAYPEGAFEALSAAYETVERNAQAKRVIEDNIMGYGRAVPNEYDFPAMLERVDALAEAVGVSRYTLHFLNYLLLTPKMREHYIERGIDLSIFRDSMDDFRLKLVECLKMHGVYGTHAPSWHKYFFKMELFTLGRLQFHPIKGRQECTVCGVKVDGNTTLLNTHIPSSGPLKIEDCVDSFARAERFFKDEFPTGGPTLFYCDSWLLFPEHKVMLPETSGIRRFAELFTLVEAKYFQPTDRSWTIFGDKRELSADKLPDGTSLQRAYKERCMKGLPSGSGCGIIVFKDGRILNTDRDRML